MKNIAVIADTSGSMAEDDKNAVVRYVLGSIANLREKREFSSYCFELYEWGASTRKAEDWDNIKLSFAGRTDVEALGAVLEEGDSSLLIVSDGNFPKKTLKALKDLCLKYRTAAVSVGMDASRSALRDITTNGEVFSVTEIAAAIKSL